MLSPSSPSSSSNHLAVSNVQARSPTPLVPENPLTHASQDQWNQYVVVSTAGSGQHGSVYRCKDTRHNGAFVAIKVVNQKNSREDKAQKLRQNRPSQGPNARLKEQYGITYYKVKKEIAIMKKLHHPHVVRLLEVINDDQRERIFMVMEYCEGGEIKWRTQDFKPVLLLEQTRRITRDVILGLEYLHHQGIIHRDIKPANLLWTKDRRTVKITDFGVSHFSYAQRLAAATKQEIDQDGDNDKVLMDDSDLSQTAGTPFFLAPEVVAEPVLVPPSSPSSSSLGVDVLRKPPITKAIDVWALGVTLYGLLFGHLPWQAEEENALRHRLEYLLHGMIREQDWQPEDFMAWDRVPTGGRHPPNDGSDGYVIMSVLDAMLQKDVQKRITIPELKRNSWFTRGIPDVEAWLRQTSPTVTVSPTHQETDSAMSPLRFSWSSSATRIKKMISGLRVRNPLSVHHSGTDAHSLGSVTSPKQSWLQTQSQPNASSSSYRRHHRRHDDHRRPSKHTSERQLRQQTRRTRSRDSTDTVKRRDKRREQDRGKEQPSTHSVPITIKSAPGTPATGDDDSTSRSKSSERWQRFRHSQSTGTMLAVSSGTTIPKQRRGSDVSQVRSSMSAVALSEAVVSTTPQASSPSTATLTDLSTPHSKRSFWSLFRYSKQEAPKSDVSETTSGTSSPSTSPAVHSPPHSAAVPSVSSSALSRRSEEAMRHFSRRSLSSGRLTNARRASSWGDPTDFTEARSPESPETPLDYDSYYMGAGGITNENRPPLSLSGQSITSLGLVEVPVTLIRHPQPGGYYTASCGTSSVPQTPDAAARDASRQIVARAPTPSPLTQEVVSPVEERNEEEDDGDMGGDTEDDMSSLGRPRPTRHSSYGDEDDSDDEDAAIEFKGRTSSSATRPTPSRTPTPPLDSDGETL